MTACSTILFPHQIQQKNSQYKTYYTDNVDEVLEAKRKRIPIAHCIAQNLY